MEREIKRVKHGRYVQLEPAGMGHATGYDPNLWKGYVIELLGSVKQ
jgi:hypothetical protein